MSEKRVTAKYSGKGKHKHDSPSFKDSWSVETEYSSSSTENLGRILNESTTTASSGITSNDKNKNRTSVNTNNRINLRSVVAKIVQWGSEKERLENSIHDKQEESSSLDMRRRTIDDVLRGPSTRRPSVVGSYQQRQSRRSLGLIDADNLKKEFNLLNMAMPLTEELRKQKLLKKFKFYVRISVLMYRWWKRHYVSEVSQTNPFYMQFQMINDSTEVITDNATDFKASYFKANKQMRMSQEAIRILTLLPEQRSKEDVYYAMIALRGIDSIADYPLRMQEALARHGIFQNYGPKRIIVKQCHKPDYFYFILFGTVVVATLEPGEPYAKTRITLRRGENFGELAIAHRIPRQSTVLTMEYTEFLTIDVDTYETIFMSGGVKTIHDLDHNNFMRSLFFLKEWPVEKLQSNPKAMEFCYFRRNTVMVKDSNMSEWIYIVKSGSLKVYKKLRKCYPTINRRTGNYTVLAHTDGYESFMSQESQYHRYAMYNNVHMPPPLSPESDSEDDEALFKGNIEEKENLLALPLMQRIERLIRPRTAHAGVIATYGHSTVKRNIRSAKNEGATVTKLIEIDSPDQRTLSSFSRTDTTLDLTSTTPDSCQQGKRTLMDDWESSARLKNEEHLQRLQFSERQNTASTIHFQEASDINPNTISKPRNVFVTDLKKEVTAADLDPEFVLVQTLTKGQAFGIQQLFLKNQPSLILVSGGAECVMLSKKFYREYMDPNMVQNLKQQISPYPTDEDLQRNLQIRVNWQNYRKITIKKLYLEQNEGKPPVKLKHKNKFK